MGIIFFVEILWISVHLGHCSAAIILLQQFNQN